MPVSFTRWREEKDLPHTLFQIARDQYVGARLAFVGGASFPSQLAMQQCVEVGAKAILKADNSTIKFSGQAGHRLRKLLEAASNIAPSLHPLLHSADTSTVIDVLESGYNEIRYGEGILGMELAGALHAFDTIAWILLWEVGSYLRYQRPLVLTVAERSLDTFFWRQTLRIENVVKGSESGETSEWALAQVVVGAPGESG